MNTKRFFSQVAKTEGEVVVEFGEAKLIKTVDGKFELRGGSKDDLIAAREWISLFMNDKVIRER